LLFDLKGFGARHLNRQCLGVLKVFLIPKLNPTPYILQCAPPSESASLPSSLVLSSLSLFYLFLPPLSLSFVPRENNFCADSVCLLLGILFPPPYSVFAHVYNICCNNLIITTHKDNKNIIFSTCIHTKFERPLLIFPFFSHSLSWVA
jgi:hypothetical protein